MRKNHTNPDCSQNYGGHMTDRCDCDAGHDEMSEMITELRAENAELKAVVGRLFPFVKCECGEYRDKETGEHAVTLTLKEFMEREGIEEQRCPNASVKEPTE